MRITNPVEQTIIAYDQIASTYSNAWFGHPSIELLDPFIERIGQRKLILDAACGPGRDTCYFMNQEITAIGIDMSKGMIIEARSRVPNGKFVQMDIRHLAFPQNCFGGIWACAVLVHIPPSEITLVLKSFYRTLENGGILFIAFHESQNSLLPEEKVSEDGRYFVAYPEQTIRQELLNSGFISITTQRQISHRSTYGNVEIAIHWLDIWARK